MAKIPINIGGGGGTTSDDCTATAADVLAGKTAIYNGSDDEAANGSMTDKSGTTSSASITANSSNARMELTVPAEGKYDTAAKLYTPYSDLASAAGLTAAKVATGNSLIGVSGSYTGVGTATADKVLSGNTFSSASLSGASGTMTDKSGSTSSASSSLDSSNSRVRLQIPTNAYYNTSAYLYASYADIASIIGLTANKIKKGTTILGIAGTYAGTDYGNPVKLYNSGYITIGYATNAAGASTSRIYEGSSGYAGATGGNYSVDGYPAETGGYFWFPTQQKLDVRGYTYAAVVLELSFAGYFASGVSIYPRPFFATSNNTNDWPSSDTIIYGSDTTLRMAEETYGGSSSSAKLVTFIDLSNCTTQDKYLKFGYQVGAQNASSNAILPRLRINDDIYLYQDKSDCNIDTSDASAVWTITY